jgi:hypothetical protein
MIYLGRAIVYFFFPQLLLLFEPTSIQSHWNQVSLELGNKRIETDTGNRDNEYRILLYLL